MIPVTMAPEPETFDEQVRRRGHAFLKRTPRPTTAQFRTQSYWRASLPELHAAYHGICAYSCHYIPLDTGADTVEHFLAKSANPTLAYDWENYRLVCQTLNGRKGEHTDVLDPFTLAAGWFRLAFPSLLIHPAPDASSAIHDAVKATCKRLGLNDLATCLAARERYVRDFCLGDITWNYLLRDAPFLASEIERQGLRARLREMMRYDGTPDPDWPRADV